MAHNVLDNLEGGLGAIDEHLDPMLPETHYQDGSGTNTNPVPASGMRAVDSLVVNISQGTDAVSRRLGQEIRVTRIIVRATNYFDTNDPNYANRYDAIRWILVIDHQCNGAVASFGQVVSVPNIRGFRNLDNARRFTILYDKTDQASPIWGTTQRYYYWQTNIDVEVDIPILYSNSTGTISGIRSNNISLFCVSRDGQVKFQDLVYRVKYDDM